MVTKNTIRKQIAAQRARLDVAWITKSSQHIATKVQAHSLFNASQTIALYSALPGEVDLQHLFKPCWQQKKRTCVPVFEAETNQYVFAEITPDTALHLGRYQIPEPSNPQVISLEEIDLMLVPGVAFNPNTGDRLGRGGGYYDRLLASFSGHTFGIGFSFQLFNSIPIEPTDQPVNALVTEDQLISF